MKKYFISLALFISVSGSVVYANTSNDPVTGANTGSDKINTRVQAAFKKEFAGASPIKWERLKENIYLVHFMYNNERINAFFDATGEHVATGRFVGESALPLLVRSNVAHKYASYNVQQVIELTQNGETTYLLTLENEQAKLEVQAYNNGSLEVIKKEKRIL